MILNCPACDRDEYDYALPAVCCDKGCEFFSESYQPETSYGTVTESPRNDSVLMKLEVASQEDPFDEGRRG